MANLERSLFPGSSLELETRQVGKKTTRSLVGYAATWDQPSEPIPFREVVRRGAFTKTLQEGDQRALWNHDPASVLGRRSAGTLELSEDDQGLRVRISPPDTQAGRDALETIARRDVTSMSFGFRSVKDTFRNDPDLGEIRELHEVDLVEVSPVPFAAYPDTSIAVRAKLEAVGRDLTRPDSGPTLSPAELEEYLAQKRERLSELEKN